MIEARHQNLIKEEEAAEEQEKAITWLVEVLKKQQKQRRIDEARSYVNSLLVLMDRYPEPTTTPPVSVEALAVCNVIFIPSDILKHISTFMHPEWGEYDEALYFASSLLDDGVLEYCIMKRFEDQDKQGLGIVCASIAHSGNLNAIRRLKEMGYPCNEMTCTAAAYGGHLRVLKWLHEQGCPWSEDTVEAAALRGDLDMLKWLDKRGCPSSKDAPRNAVQGGHLEVLQWFYSNGCPSEEYDQIAFIASEYGHLKVLEWLRGQGYPCDNQDYSSAAARNGHLEVLQWLYDQGCPCNEDQCVSAILGGHLEVVKWLYSRGYALTNKFPTWVDPLHLDFEILKWLCSQDCPMCEFQMNLFIDALEKRAAFMFTN
jgi:hypothetical protein